MSTDPPWESPRGRPFPYPDVPGLVVRSLTEQQLGDQLAGEGHNVRLAHGRYWRQTRVGFYEPVHWLARLRASEAQRPGLCWGYRNALCASDTKHANATIPVHLLADIAPYDAAVLPKSLRRYLRTLSRDQIRIVHASDEPAFLEQAYDVMLDWRARVGRPRPAPSRDEYSARMTRRLTNEGWLIVAAIHGSQLMGYTVAWAVEGTAYLHENIVSTDGLRHGVSNGLDFAVIQVFRRSAQVREVCAGLHQPELPGLTRFKERQGFPVTQLPARTWLAGPADHTLRRLNAHRYYRLTGSSSGSNVLN